MFDHLTFGAFSYRSALWRLAAVLSLHVISLAANATDLRVVMDVSPQMVAVDPQNRTGAVVERVVQALSDQDHAGLWSVGRYARQVLGYGETNAMWRQLASIHLRNPNPDDVSRGGFQALQAATWDVSQNHPHRRHVWLVLAAPVALSRELDDPQEQQIREELLNEWLPQIIKGRISIHTLLLGDAVEQDLWRQLSSASGGLHRHIQQVDEVDEYATDLLRLLSPQNEAVVDDNGRFRIDPGVQHFTVLWGATSLAQPQREIRTPDGTSYNRLRTMPTGRWLIGEHYEMATLEQPEPGWWQVDALPQLLTVVGDLQITVSGLEQRVIPDPESSALIHLRQQDRIIDHTEFLQLLSVRAWLLSGDKRLPLPIEREGSSYRVFFVNLEDGAHELEVSVVGPTFSRRIVQPFEVQHPLMVEVRRAEDLSYSAWLYFSHAEVDFASVKAAAKIRKPPNNAKLMPAVKLPAGVWQVPFPDTDGVLETTYSISGNYMNGKGFFLSTKPLVLTLAEAAETPLQFRFDASGKRIKTPEPISGDVQATLGSQPGPTPELAADDQLPVIDQVPPDPVEPQWATLPWWFVALISVLNLLLGVVVWWLFKPKHHATSELEQPA